ncbi:conserved hypothetical protein [Synechococcus elongatus PCC 7942 = FACHB-805]|uniref:Uncharacterized protein n=2 Tax=Synechococcus elongatus TaxID=32046 RepID=Q31R71_SYNE7|nr:hypothetical protein [Synechococcus elongatus]ABB56448.1 conserved hypothetical protein [Synechococcus elongatus PCC 7942 = FACHB-805]WKW05999.1 hypothetical protein QY054_02145 [Synechococcus elongatus PCC 7942 = FACHB-805]
MVRCIPGYREHSDSMQDKQKVTFYLPPDLHRQLKIRAAVDLEPMSAIAEKALQFYLEHSEVVEEAANAHGSTFRVYHCPDCTSPVVLKHGELASLRHQPNVLQDDANLTVEPTPTTATTSDEELVPC